MALRKRAKNSVRKSNNTIYDVHYIVSGVCCSDEQLLPYSDMYGRGCVNDLENKMEMVLGRWLNLAEREAVSGGSCGQNLRYI